MPNFKPVLQNANVFTLTAEPEGGGGRRKEEGGVR